MSQKVTAVLCLVILPRTEAIVESMIPSKFVSQLTIIKPHLAINQQHCFVAKAVVQTKTQKCVPNFEFDGSTKSYTERLPHSCSRKNRRFAKI